MGDFSGCYIKVLYTLCRNQKQIYEIIKNNGPTLFASITHHVKSVAHFLFATKEKKKKTSESCSSYIWIQDCVGGTRIAGHVPSA